MKDERKDIDFAILYVFFITNNDRHAELLFLRPEGFFSIVTVNYTYRKSQIDLSKEKNLKTEG